MIFKHFNRIIDFIRTVDTTSFQSPLSASEFKERIEQKYGLNKSFKLRNIIHPNVNEYGGKIDNESFIIEAQKTKNPNHFFFTQINGQYISTEYGTTITVKAQVKDSLSGMILTGFTALSIISYYANFNIIYPLLIIIGGYFFARTQIQQDFDSFIGKFNFYSTEQNKNEAQQAL